jgi:hypothetical protein
MARGRTNRCETEKTRFRVDWETKERVVGKEPPDRPATIAVGGCRCWATRCSISVVDSQLKQAFKI